MTAPDGDPPTTGSPGHNLSQVWLDKLEIREVIERSARYIDDRAPALLAELFEEEGVLQVAGTVFAGRAAIRGMLAGPDGPSPPHWTAPGRLLRQPGAAHRLSNPVIEVEGDRATAETDLLVLERDPSGRARITLVARYRDRLARHGGCWLISNRTGVSIARPGEEGTDSEWARALEAMPPATRARFRFD